MIEYLLCEIYSLVISKSNRTQDLGFPLSGLLVWWFNDGVIWQKYFNRLLVLYQLHCFAVNLNWGEEESIGTQGSYDIWCSIYLRVSWTWYVDHFYQNVCHYTVPFHSTSPTTATDGTCKYTLPKQINFSESNLAGRKASSVLRMLRSTSRRWYMQIYIAKRN